MHQEEWQPRAAAHAARVAPWVSGRLERRAAGRPNAIEDFLFEYYGYSPNKLATWHPGHGIVLEGPAAREYLTIPGYVETRDGITVDIRALEPRGQRLDLAIRILEGIGSRDPMTGCFALHEWAMTYRLTQEELRHSYLPLRISPEQVASTVDELGLRCTHIDAFRFFTPEATPLNSLEPTRATQPDLDQPGCLHASMDLYKYAYWFSPFIGSELIADCFVNAAQARELDMRASPYDMTPFGLTAIEVETAEGRREYAHEQQLMVERTAPLRERLLEELRRLSMVAQPAN